MTAPSCSRPLGHCWHHLEDVTFSATIHFDVSRCCHCGEDRQQRYELVAEDGHGPHAPKTVRRKVEG